MTSLQLADQILVLRLAVSVLGGPAGSGWWKCDFLSESGLEVAKYNFPRRPVVAAYRAAVIAAKRLHDERIGRRGIKHLFRLPLDVENLLHARTAAGGAEVDVVTEIPNPRRAMDQLQEIAVTLIDPPEGPVQVGYIADCWSTEALAELARHYQAAFRSDIQVFPYFAAKM